MLCVFYLYISLHYVVQVEGPVKETRVAHSSISEIFIRSIHN